ncbi:putative CdaR family transcriptional regulator [Streptomyces sp. NBRC 110611]|uniref:PucR family transcriptional regulator n=1 Tax=Streptomyces sp. NBRC 110611 TaxID=1621259 RepID=UPI0008583B70|nr:helix-turn-helix domain-containing protein [Streptomyces sp. NBRC 110611]GAU71153.1 putative CdaR family transcriptional regulator [Streptomyces sp. NBRC 110611]
MTTGHRAPHSPPATPRATGLPPSTAVPVGEEESALRPADLDRYLGQLARVSVTRRPLPDGYLDDIRQLAATAAARGTALRPLVAALLNPACRAWPDLPGTLQAQDLPELHDVASALMRAISETTVALTEGYETAHRAAIRGEEATRREFVDDLLEGPANLGRLAERAEHFGLRLVGPHTVAVARAADPFGAGDPATRYVEEALTARFSSRDVLITTKDALLVCVAPSTVPEVPHHFASAVCHAVGAQYTVAISRPRPGPGGIVRSYHEARSTLDLATRLHLTAPVVDTSDVLVFQVLGRDHAAITDLVATVLGGLQAARGGPRTLLDTLTTYFASGCLNAVTARRLGLSVRTIGYRLGRIRQLTGHDPTDPDQRYILQTAALGAQLLDWPARPLQPTD